MSNPLKKLASQTAVYGLGSVLPRVITFLYSFVLTYIFKQPSELSANTEFYAYISFINILFTYGMETAFFHFSNKIEEKERVYSTALMSIFGSTVGLSLLFILFSGSIADFIKEPEHVNYIIWCVLIVATDAMMAIPFARLRLNNQAKKFGALKLLNVFVFILICIFYFNICKPAYVNEPDSALAKFYNPEVGVGYMFLAGLLANLVSLLFLSKEFIAVQYVFDKDLWKQMLNYAWPLLILGFAGMINETFDRFILKYLLPEGIAENELGIYGACYRIAMFMTIFTTAFKYAAEPFFFNHAKHEDAKKLNALVMKYYVLFCLFLFLGTMMNLPWLKYVVSEKFRDGLGVVPILLLANLCVGVYWNLSIWFKLTGQTKFGAMITVTGAVITLVINFVGIPKFGYMACAWATLASYGIMMITSYILGQKYYPVKYNLRSISVFTFLALGFYFISTLYSGLDNEIIKLILNNILLSLYAFIFYKLEFDNLKKLKHLES
ncbi:MAG TPA: oligosaccharide flippase family protein [Bacteroidia bacterium]|nr:oligosaccharide flippase family protein [Bacteroidia bacterium]